MSRQTAIALVPGCVALTLAAAALVIHLLHPPLSVAAKHSIDIGSYQLRFRCGLELVEIDPPAPGALLFESTEAVADSAVGAR